MQYRIIIYFLVPVLLFGCKEDAIDPSLTPLVSQFSVNAYDLSFQIDADQSNFTSLEKVTVTANTTVQQIEFEIHADLILDALLLEEPDGKSIPLDSWQEIGDNTYQRGTENEVFTRYKIMTSSNIFSGETVVLQLAYHIQSSAVHSSLTPELLKFSISTTGSRAIHPVSGIFPYFGGLVAAPFKVELTFPQDQYSCVPGNQISTETHSGKTTEKFESLVALIPVFYVGPGNKVGREQNDITVEFLLAQGQSVPDEVIDQTFASAQLFNASIGDPGTETYRFAFIAVSASSTTGESKGNAIYFAERSGNPFQWDENSSKDFIQLVNHEMFHNWNIWYVRWQGAFYEWFVEGGAGFMATWATEQNLGAERGSDSRLDFVEGFYTNKGYMASRTLENVQKGSNAENALIYSYGALVWEQLRQKLGDADFEAGLHEFYTQFGYQSADYSDLIASLRNHTPVQVEEYLELWIRHNAQIDLSIADVSIAQNGNLFETSVQVAIISDRDYEIFSALGYRTTVSGEVTIVDIHTKQDGMHQVDFVSSEKPVYIIIDPEHRVPQLELNNDVWSE